MALELRIRRVAYVDDAFQGPFRPSERCGFVELTSGGPFSLVFRLVHFVLSLFASLSESLWQVAFDVHHLLAVDSLPCFFLSLLVHVLSVPPFPASPECC